MAQSSKDKLKRYAPRLMEKLQALDCPYVEDVDESWVIDLLFKPGEHRVRLLQWLFSKFDSSLEAILDPESIMTESKIGSKIQRLLFIASSLGLCHKDDVDLIRGCGSVSEQFSFMEQLLDLVYIKDRAEDVQMLCMNSADRISEGLSVKEQFDSACSFTDALVDQENVNTVLTSEVRLLPPDIAKQIDIRNEKKAQKGEPTQLELPEISRLQETVTELSKDLQRQEEILAHLKDNHEEPPDESQSTEIIQRMLRLVLSELSQILVGFSYCFENEFYHWCNKTPPQLNEIGPTFKRIHGPLQNFTKMLSGVSTVRSSHKVLCLHLSEQAKTLAKRMGKNLEENNLLKDVEDYIDILEDAISRMNAVSAGSKPNTSDLSNVVRCQ